MTEPKIVQNQDESWTVHFPHQGTANCETKEQASALSMAWRVVWQPKPCRDSVKLAVQRMHENGIYRGMLYRRLMRMLDEMQKWSEWGA